MTDRPCRCSHHAKWHAHPTLGYPTCLLCRCPEYRPLETAETLTLHGIDTNDDDQNYRLRNMAG